MKKGFLKCFALSLVLVSSLQFGSFAAKKNVQVSNYKPKIQLAGLAKSKKSVFKANSVDTNSNLEIADFAGYYRLDTSKTCHFLDDIIIKEALEELNANLNLASIDIDKNGKVIFCMSIDGNVDEIPVNLTLTEAEQLIKNNNNEFTLNESSNFAQVKCTAYIPELGFVSCEITPSIDLLAERNGYDKLHIKNIDGTDYLIWQSEDGISYFQKVL